MRIIFGSYDPFADILCTPLFFLPFYRAETGNDRKSGMAERAACGGGRGMEKEGSGGHNKDVNWISTLSLFVLHSPSGRKNTVKQGVWWTFWSEWRTLLFPIIMIALNRHLLNWIDKCTNILETEWAKPNPIPSPGRCSIDWLKTKGTTFLPQKSPHHGPLPSSPIPNPQSPIPLELEGNSNLNLPSLLWVPLFLLPEGQSGGGRVVSRIRPALHFTLGRIGSSLLQNPHPGTFFPLC